MEARPEVSASSAAGEGNAKQPAKVKLKLRGLKIEAVDKDRGVVTVSRISPVPDFEGLPPGTEIDGRVELFFKRSVFVDIGQEKSALLNITTGAAKKLRCGESLSLVVEGVDGETRRTIVALAPAARTDVAARAPDRRPVAEFEEGMEIDGYVQGYGDVGIFFDVHAVRNAVAMWKDNRERGSFLRIGDRVRLNVIRVDASRENMDVAILGKAPQEAVPGRG